MCLVLTKEERISEIRNRSKSLQHEPDDIARRDLLFAMKNEMLFTRYEWQCIIKHYNL